jgi:hypothetical protein
MPQLYAFDAKFPVAIYPELPTAEVCLTKYADAPYPPAQPFVNAEISGVTVSEVLTVGAEKLPVAASLNGKIISVSPASVVSPGAAIVYGPEPPQVAKLVATVVT